MNELSDALDELVEQNAELGGDDVESKAYHMRDNIIPAMARGARGGRTGWRRWCPDDFWPLPTYRDMLFIK